jgi:hypothetical protein
MISSTIQVQKFYQKYLMDDLYLLSENNTQTGSVSSSGAVADSLLLGESSGNSFSSVLSFNTANMADTTLKKASIFLRRKSLAGTNPISNTLSVKVKSGNFGSTVNVEAADYSATGMPQAHLVCLVQMQEMVTGFAWIYRLLFCL